MSEHTHSNNATIDEARSWLAHQFDLAIAASGDSEGWHWRAASVELPWQARGQHRDDILQSLAPLACSADGSSARIGTSLVNRATPRMTVMAGTIRQAWEESAWVVSDVYPEEVDLEPYFLAERDDGAMLSFQRFPEHVIIRAYSTCSSHASVTRWPDG